MIIYSIQNMINEKCYIGLSVTSLSKRKGSHLSRLKKGKHGNSHLQRSYDKYGENNFKFTVLEEDFDCIEDLKKAEIFWINFLGTLNSDYGYNILKGGNVSWLGHKRPKFAKKISGQNHHYYGTTVSDKLKKLLSDRLTEGGSPKSKTVMQLTKKGLIISCFDSLSQAERFTGAKYQHISAVCRGKRLSAGGFVWRYI